MHTDQRTEALLGYQVWCASQAACIEEMAAHARDGQGCHWLACLNPHSYAVAADDPLFRQALTRAHWLVPDGVGVVLASRSLGGTVQGRITGADVFLALNARLALEGRRSVYLLGASDLTLATMRERMGVDFPGLSLAGSCSPPFRAAFSPAETDAMIEAINRSGADVLWVAMTAPKQEKWLLENEARLEVRVAGAIGAVFDFYAGNVQRSSPLFQKLGLEWLPRLLREPRRLWRRTFVSAPLFVLHVLRARLGRRG